MSIAHIHLNKAIRFTETDVASFAEKPYQLQAYAHGVVLAASTNGRYSGNAKHLDDVVFLIGDAYRMGKCSLTPVTSQWVKEHYPSATHELFVTIISNENVNETHVVIFYLP